MEKSGVFWAFLGTILALALICGIAGCPQASPTCNKPYIAVGTTCCLDQNNNSICDSDEKTENNANQAAGNETASAAWTKTSGYTVAECEEVCNAWDTIGSVTNCKDDCVNHFGKPSGSLDEFVNMVKKNAKTGADFGGL